MQQRQVVEVPRDARTGDRDVDDLPGQKRLWSSTMFSTRKRRQSASWSLTTSSDQRCIGRAGTCGVVSRVVV